MARARRPSAWLTEKGRWISDRPWAMVVVLALVGLGIRHAWLSPQPLSAGDWHWPDNPVLANYSPWPSVWDSSLGLGGENRFSAAFRFPIYAIVGLFSVLGAGWTVTEKLFYFVPFAILLPVGGWLLAREIMGRTKWALLTPVLLLGATYFMLESNGEVPLALGEVISFFVLLTFLKTVRQLSVRWALITGLLLAVVALYDIRPAYLCVLLMAMYFVIVTVIDRNWHTLLRRVALGAVAGGVFVGLQAFWLVPLLTYHGGVGLPIPQAPNFNVLTLGHGITGVDAFWTGGTPAQLVQAPLNPAYMILPLLALTPLLARRMRPEVLWLTVAALLFAFFAKTDNAPLGGIYDWMYLHVPGWKLFREGSKFLYIVTLAYAILVPMALATAFEWCAAHAVRMRVRARALRAGAAAALVGVIALSAWSVVVLQTGTLGSTTQSTPEPAAFTAFSKILADDARPGPVLWFGQPLVGNNIHNHHFLIASPTHPAVNLTGKFGGSRTNQRDPFQLYCPDNVIAYCYLDPTLVSVPGADGRSRLYRRPRRPGRGLAAPWGDARLATAAGVADGFRDTDGFGQRRDIHLGVAHQHDAARCDHGARDRSCRLRNVGNHGVTSRARSVERPGGVSPELRQQSIPRGPEEPSRQHRRDAKRQQRVPFPRGRRGRGDGPELGCVHPAHHQREFAHAVVADTAGTSADSRLGVECVWPIPDHQRHQHSCAGRRNISDGKWSNSRTVPELVFVDGGRARHPHQLGERYHTHLLRRAGDGINQLRQWEVG